jgi:hypothetical protein
MNGHVTKSRYLFVDFAMYKILREIIAQANQLVNRGS